MVLRERATARVILEWSRPTGFFATLENDSVGRRSEGSRAEWVRREEQAPPLPVNEKLFGISGQMGAISGCFCGQSGTPVPTSIEMNAVGFRGV